MYYNGSEVDSTQIMATFEKRWGKWRAMFIIM